jgi:uncharacterized protein (TIGR03437 family)
MNFSVRMGVVAIGALLALAGLGLPALAGTVSFSFDLTGTATGSAQGFSFGTVFTGPLPPFGNCSAYFGEGAFGTPLPATFTFADGATIKSTFVPKAVMAAEPSETFTGTIVGGTGIFAGATGSYSVAFSLSSPPKAGATVPVPMTGTGTITVSDAGGVSLLPGALFFQSTGSTAAEPQVLILNNQGLTPVTFSFSTGVAAGPTWLSASTQSTTVPAGGTSTIVATASPAGLQQGVYRGEVAVSLAGNTTYVPAFFLIGNDSSTLATTETGIYLQTEFTGPPVTQYVGVANVGADDLAGLTAVATPINSSTTAPTPAQLNWLEASLPSGFAEQQYLLVPFTVNPGTLPVGVYYGTIKFTLPHANNSPQTVGVLMEVVDTVVPTVTPTDALFQANSMPEVFTITNPTTQTLPFTVAFDPMTSPTNAGWVSYSPSSGSIPPGGTAQITLTETVSGCSSSPNCSNNFVTGAHAYLDVTFPILNKTIIFGIELAPSQQFCAQGVMAACSAGTPSLRPSRQPHVAASCTPTQLSGVFTAMPYNFQAVTGRPQPLEVQIVDDCQNYLNSGTVVASFSTGETPLTLQSFGSGKWSATWLPRSASANEQITVQAISIAGAEGLALLPGSVIAGSAVPLIASDGVRDAASGSDIVAPGDFISIYGSDLAGGTTVTDLVPFPTSLGNVQATLGGEPLPLYFTASGQIDAIVPFDVPLNGTLQVIVQNGTALSQPEAVVVAAAAPAVFTQNQSGSGPGAILGQKPGKVAALNTAANPASAGDALLIFCTGLGTVTPPVTAGSAASTTILSSTDNPVTVTVGGKDAQVLFAGLAPGFVGLYQVNVIVPSGIGAADDVPVVLTEAGATSAPVTVAIK